MPGLPLIDIITQKVQVVQTHRAMRDQFAVTYYIFQIPYKAQLEKHHRGYALLTALSVKPLGQWIKKIQINGALQTTVKIVHGNAFAELKTGEQLLLCSPSFPAYLKFAILPKGFQKFHYIYQQSCTTGTGGIINCGRTFSWLRLRSANMKCPQPIIHMTVRLN